MTHTALALMSRDWIAVQGEGSRLDDIEQHEPLILYLDIDGVVTTAGYQLTAGKDRIDPAAVAVVTALVREFGAVVVVSSTWRVADCRPTLVEAGLAEDCFFSDWCTAIPDTSRNTETGDMLPADQADRGEEIAEHVTRNHINRYLVLDDVDLGSAHAGRHVRPDPERGLTAADGAFARKLVARMDTLCRGRNLVSGHVADGFTKR